ncbi:transcriptional regulator [Lapillicoccus jejuensis]|uniref:MucB/RseB-like sigma(E) regulatory protein n=1 Tax=Lapillicoccus jejuensis TaxID=402171 RepID=A0A542E6J9_9MICO|nr:transcriptional regulator [Lapillicoccus jejuensis]TQJ10958.1 hypothetical protein FB458_4102 [Lapillicoccus jejuensis]
MNRRGRWTVVLLVVAVLVSLPSVVGAWPVGASDRRDAAALLARVRAAADHPYSGYAESTGSLALPTGGQLSDVASLLGGRTQQRVWWRGPTDWRADTLSPTGELSSRTSAGGTQVFDFEDTDVARSAPDVPGAVRLPRATDTLPPALAARLLSGATAGQVLSLPARRVAGRVADGLRLTPDEPLSSIAHVDVWADRESGVPLTVEVSSRTSATPALSTTFLDFSPGTPDEQVVAFTPPPGARVFTRRRLDLARAVGRDGDASSLPATLLGLPRATAVDGLPGVAQYGRGVTRLAVGELPGEVAGSLRAQLRAAAGVTAVPEGLEVAVGPVGLLVTDPAVTGRSWLLAGTLTPAGLAQAAAALPRAAS